LLDLRCCFQRLQLVQLPAAPKGRAGETGLGMVRRLADHTDLLPPTSARSDRPRSSPTTAARATARQDRTAPQPPTRIIQLSPGSLRCGQIRPVNSRLKLARRVPFLVHTRSKGKTARWQGVTHPGSRRRTLCRALTVLNFASLVETRQFLLAPRGTSARDSVQASPQGGIHSTQPGLVTSGSRRGALPSLRPGGLLRFESDQLGISRSQADQL